MNSKNIEMPSKVSATNYDKDRITNAALSYASLNISYGEKPAVISVDANFPKNSMCAIIGPNGAGKSTLLKSVIGAVKPLSGNVFIFGQQIENIRKRIAYVPQRVSVDWDFPTNVMDVVKMGLFREVGLLGRFTSHLNIRTKECLDRVGMADFAERQIGELSGGQQQRVFLARALVQNADLYLLDEPFAGVDAATERAIIDVLKILKAQGKSIIAVHHDLSTVRNYFDYVLMINVRGIVEGTIEEVFTNKNLQATYGGKLTANYLDELSISKGT